MKHGSRTMVSIRLGRRESPMVDNEGRLSGLDELSTKSCAALRYENMLWMAHRGQQRS